MKYTVIVHRDIQEGGVWGECPELPGCYSQGESVGELMRNMREAAELYLDEPENAYVFPVPVHSGRNIKPGLLLSILNRAGIDVNSIRR
ncbi:MAG: type II toxin-antitoxin system HicB family antitoxin [Synergistaceae bacterium]|nr:type II toxin-antitoxin system HicB family antitoxin [Synergistaceae bacterium]